eukprot:TRINITY_DN7806_c0_g1_i1.p1 TRINITY_DN7806_c0_g1~~TRINITY_DN7806_c0_g1_i1.p1  ORF type:complete len:130 (+),score=34.92 TRINITY_DN7806_c0_g1_i1:550-939(+)
MDTEANLDCLTEAFSGSISLDKNTLHLFTDLLLSLPKEQLITRLQNPALMRKLSAVFSSTTPLIRREAVMTYASLSLSLGPSFESYLYELNARSQKLISVYKSKKASDLSARVERAQSFFQQGDAVVGL